MAMPLSELIKINDQNVADVDGISDLLQDAPFFNAVLAVEASNGTQHKYLKETKAPVVGFRDPNDGRDTDSSEDTLVTISLEILDATFDVDQAIADEFDTVPYGKGRAAFMAREGQRHIRAAFKKAEQQTINGTGADADGFQGFADVLSALSNPMVEGGGGVAADVQTSVYLVRSTPDEENMLLVTGDGGKIKVGDEFQQMKAGSSTGRFPTYVQPIYAWMGVQMGSIHSVGRLANLDATSPLDDAKLAKAIKMFPASRKPTHLLMNGDALEQLRASRTATNATGAPAPWPDEAHRIPIIETDSITSTEAVVA